MKLQALLDSWITHNRAAYYGNTETAYRYHVKPLIDFLPRYQAEDVGPPHIAECMNHLIKKGANPNSVRHYAKIWRIMFQHAVIVLKIVSSNPVAWESLPRIRKARITRQYFTQSQYLRVKHEASIGPRYRECWPAACTIGWHTGLRMSDVARLEWPWVNFDDQALSVWPKKKEALRENLIIPMEPELFTVLLALWNTRDPECKYVLEQFHMIYNADRTALIYEFGTIVVKAGLPKHTFHSFRHGFVTRLLNANVNTKIICSMTGMTESQVNAYAHPSVDAKVAALRRSREFVAEVESSKANPTPGVAASEF